MDRQPRTPATPATSSVLDANMALQALLQQLAAASTPAPAAPVRDEPFLMRLADGTRHYKDGNVEVPLSNIFKVVSIPDVLDELPTARLVELAGDGTTYLAQAHIEQRATNGDLEAADWLQRCPNKRPKIHGSYELVDDDLKPPAKPTPTPATITKPTAELGTPPPSPRGRALTRTSSPAV